MAGVALALAYRGRWTELFWRSFPLAIGLCTIGIQLGYYTFVIRGDHFEYRVYSFTVPLVFASFVWALARIDLAARAAIACLALFVALSYPLPWVHFLETRDLQTRSDTIELTQPIAHRFPALVLPYVALFDELQEWLISRAVGIRHQEHSVFRSYQLRRYWSREEGLGMDRDRFWTLALRGVGVAGWVYPHAVIIDKWGLNDYVVARTPPLHKYATRGRHMAHDRSPPPGYVECFAPNLVEENGAVVIKKRPRPLRPLDIIECESRDWLK